MEGCAVKEKKMDNFNIYVGGTISIPEPELTEEEITEQERKNEEYEREQIVINREYYKTHADIDGIDVNCDYFTNIDDCEEMKCDNCDKSLGYMALSAHYCDSLEHREFCSEECFKKIAKKEKAKRKKEYRDFIKKHGEQ
jgi:hypothetical protein